MYPQVAGKKKDSRSKDCCDLTAVPETLLIESSSKNKPAFHAEIKSPALWTFSDDYCFILDTINYPERKENTEATPLGKKKGKNRWVP